MRVEPAKLFFHVDLRVRCLGYGWMYFRQTERVKLLHCVFARVWGRAGYTSTLDKQNAINFCSE
jgi:hypothetical protein